MEPAPDDPDYLAWWVETVVAGRGRSPDGPARAWRREWQRRFAACGSSPAGRQARAQGFVLTTAEARRHCLAGRRIESVGRGLVAPRFDHNPEKADGLRVAHALTAAGGALVRPGQVVSGRSAAIMHGLPTLAVPSAPELTARSDLVTRGRHGSALVRGARLPDEDVTTWFGVAVTSVSRTLVDLGRIDRFDALMAADAALRERLADEDAITAALRSAAGRWGVRRAREVLALADPRAESPLESYGRLRLHDAGFPPPEPQYWIGRYRADLAWPELGLVIEFDGKVKYDRESRWAEKRRELRISRAGFRVERIIWADLTAANWPATERYLRPLFRETPR